MIATTEPSDDFSDSTTGADAAAAGATSPRAASVKDPGAHLADGESIELDPFARPAEGGVPVFRKNGKTYIRCLIRDKDLRYKPEELVRQHILRRLIDSLGYTKGQSRVEVPVVMGSGVHDKPAACLWLWVVFVARVIAKLEPGGAQLSMLRVMRELRGHGIASVLYCGWATPAGIELARRYGAEPEIWGEGGNLQWVPEPRFAAWLDPRLTAVDLVHAHMFGAWWAAARAARAGIPLVASEHNQYLWPGRPRSAEMREALGRVDVFFAHGPSARATVIAHGLPLERVREGISPVVGTRAHAAPGLPSPRIVFAGRLDPDKGPDILVEALGLLGDPPPTLILGDGRLRGRLQRRVRELGLAKRVSFPGWVADPGPYIAGATVLAIPSRDEAFSQTAIIGLAHGVPVIGTQVDGFPATLGGGRGILVAPEDPQALAAALEQVLHDELQRPRPLRSLAERYAPARVAAIYERTYRSLVAPEAAGAQAVS